MDGLLGSAGEWLGAERIAVGTMVLLLSITGVWWAAGRYGNPGSLRLRTGNLAALGLLLLALFLLLTCVLYEPALQRLDREVFQAVYQSGSPALTRAFSLVCLVSGHVGSPLVALLAALGTWMRGRRGALPLFVFTLLGVMGLEILASAHMGRSRPVPGEYGYFLYSYPSGDTMLALALSVLLWVLWLPGCGNRWEALLVRVAALVWPPLVAFARLYVGEHFLTDVVAGFFLGGAWICLTGCYCCTREQDCPVASAPHPAGALTL